MVLERMYNLMMKRMSMGSKEENYEHVLMCLICRSLFDDHDHQPKFLPCHHTFCKDCLREYIRQIGDDIECPSCRKVATIPAAGVAALQTNFYVKYIQSLVHGGPCSDGTLLECKSHTSHKLQYYCKDCNRSICKQCCEPSEKGNCDAHNKVPLTTITEEYHQKLDTTFSKATAVVEHKKVELEAILKAFCEEKDQALLKIESTFEQHVHILTRRSTLLKNKVIAIYNEHVETLEADLEEISTALTCIVSLKEYHENTIGRGEFIEIDQGLSEMDEVQSNISEKIHPRENHIIFEEKHGMDQYKSCVKDLGRVRNRVPTVPRAEPEGNDAAVRDPGNSPLSPNHSDSDSSPSTSAGPPCTDQPYKLAQPSIPEENSEVFLTSGSDGVAAAAAPIPDIVPNNHKKQSDISSLRMACSQDDPNSGCENFQGLPVSNGGASCSTARGHPGLACRPSPGPGEVLANGLNNNIPNGLANQGQSNVMASSLSENAVVRPKTLTSPRKSKVSANNNIVKPVKGRKPSGSGEVTPTSLGACGGEAPEPEPAHFNHNEIDFGSNTTTPTGEPNNQLINPKFTHPSLDAVHALMEPLPGRLADPDLELLKQTDKMYHHLVYTSYDEEELLRELKCGKVQRESSHGKGEKYIDDSDSWMTVSTSSDGSTISGNSDGEEYRYVHTDLDTEQSTL